MDTAASFSGQAAMSTMLPDSLPHELIYSEEHPVTRGEMQSLLHPLQSCLNRMERTLQELSCAPPLQSQQQDFRSQEDDFDSQHQDSRAQDQDFRSQLQEASGSSCAGAGSGAPVDQNGKEHAEVQLVDLGMQAPLISTPSFPRIACEKPTSRCTSRESETVMTFESSHGQEACNYDSSSGAVAEPLTVTVPVAQGEPTPQPATEATLKAPEGATDPTSSKAMMKQSHVSSSCYGESSHTRSKWKMLDEMKIHQELHQSNFGHQGLVEKVLMGALEKIGEAWVSIQEPNRKGCVYWIAANNTFQSTCILVITFNAVLVAYSADWQIQHYGEPLPFFIEVLEFSCLVFFCTELALRLGAHRCYFFINSEMYWNIFDFVLVSISLVDLVFDKIVGAGGGSNVGFMRLLRLLKLARIFRSLRSFRFFKSLTVLLESFQKSFEPLFWGFIMMCFVLYLFSLIFLQALLECMTEDDLDPLMRDRIRDNFGSLKTTLISLYMAVTGGADWNMYYEIVQCAGTGYGLVFIFFTFLLNFALFNILTGSLVEKAMASSKPDRADRILSQRRVFAEQRQHFLDVCKAMDKNGNGLISEIEFQECMCNSAVLAYMASIGIEVHDCELFFQTLAKANRAESSNNIEQEVPVETFVEGCMHMKGTATAIDMQRTLYEMAVFHRDLRKLEVGICKRLVNVERLLARRLNAHNEPFHELDSQEETDKVSL